MAKTPKNNPNRKKKPKLGSGKRFSALSRSLAKRGADDPAALAAWIGRRKFGPDQMAKMAAAVSGGA